MTSYNHETVQLDGGQFHECEFIGCRLVYAGGELPSFSGCRFDRCEWRYEDAAARTMSYLKIVWDVGAKPAVQSAIKEITTQR